MASAHSATELRKMQPDDLRKEAADRRQTIAKMRIGVAMRSEKDSAAYLREKKELARLLTVLSEKRADAPSDAKKSASTPKKSALKAPKKARTVAAPSVPSV